MAFTLAVAGLPIIADHLRRRFTRVASTFRNQRRLCPNLDALHKAILFQIVYFHESNPGDNVFAAHNPRIVAWG